MTSGKGNIILPWKQLAVAALSVTGPARQLNCHAVLDEDPRRNISANRQVTSLERLFEFNADWVARDVERGSLQNWQSHCRKCLFSVFCIAAEHIVQAAHARLGAFRPLWPQNHGADLLQAQGAFEIRYTTKSEEP
jgi:hypothetical protein